MHRLVSSRSNRRVFKALLTFETTNEPTSPLSILYPVSSRSTNIKHAYETETSQFTFEFCARRTPFSASVSVSHSTNKRKVESPSTHSSQRSRGKAAAVKFFGFCSGALSHRTREIKPQTAVSLFVRLLFPHLDCASVISAKRLFRVPLC